MTTPVNVLADPLSVLADENIIWAPFPGSQSLFLSCPVKEVLYEGTRGPGKTDALLVSFAMYCGLGFGENWRGILFRETYKQLADVIAKSKKLFKQVFPDAVFNKQESTWTFPDGEQLILSYIDSPDDYWNYHGHEYPWIGFEELTNWATADCYESMHSCCRSTFKGVRLADGTFLRMPRMIRATCNPYGRGHNWVKHRFITPSPSGIPFCDDHGNYRVAIKGHIKENLLLTIVDPDYYQTLLSIKDPHKRKAWLHGSWDIVAGGIFDHLWRESIHTIDPFQIPRSWRVDRSFDDGDARPFSVGWWAESDGTEATLADGSIFCPPPKTVIRIDEWYGCTGEPNEGLRLTPSGIAIGIKEREKPIIEYMMEGSVIHPGPADNTVFNADRGRNISDIMLKSGVRWERSNKKPGSRVAGVRLFCDLLDNTAKNKKDEPHFYVFKTNREFIRTVPTLQRDKNNPDDVDTKLEDHIWDESRYRMMGRVSGGPLETTGH